MYTIAYSLFIFNAGYFNVWRYLNKFNKAGQNFCICLLKNGHTVYCIHLRNTIKYICHLYTLMKTFPVEIMNVHVTLKNFPMLICNTSLLPLPHLQAITICYLLLQKRLHFQESCISGITEYVVLFNWYLSLSIIIYKFIHVVEYVVHYFYFILYCNLDILMINIR